MKLDTSDYASNASPPLLMESDSQRGLVSVRGDLDRRLAGAGDRSWAELVERQECLLWTRSRHSGRNRFGMLVVLIRLHGHYHHVSGFKVRCVALGCGSRIEPPPAPGLLARARGRLGLDQGDSPWKPACSVPQVLSAFAPDLIGG